MTVRRGLVAVLCVAALAVAAPAAALQAASSTAGTSTATAPAQTTTAAPTTAAPTTAAPTTQPAAPAPAPAQPAASGNDHRAARLILVVLAAILVAILLLWGFARWWAWEPPWAVRWRHATAEAGWRASAWWSEFTDWLRLGR
jgi:Flp pilus assembly protein TadB